MIEYILIGIIVLCLVLLLRKALFGMVLILLGVVVTPIHFTACFVSEICRMIMNWICRTLLKLANISVEVETQDEFKERLKDDEQ